MITFTLPPPPWEQEQETWGVELLDDGTLDTVIRVTRIKTGEQQEARYQPDERPMPMTREFLVDLGKMVIDDWQYGEDE